MQRGVVNRRPFAWVGWTAVVIGLVILAFLAVIASPYLITEAPASGEVFDVAEPMAGQGQQVSQSLNELGYHCSNAARDEHVVTRECARVNERDYTVIQMAVSADSGDIKLVRTRVFGPDVGRVDGDIAAAVARAVGMTRGDQEAVRNAATDTGQPRLTLDWGSITTTPKSPYTSELRAAGFNRNWLPVSKVTFAGSVDALAAAATSRGYVCTTPQVKNIRGCTRSAGGYEYDLWMQGTNTHVATLNLGVTAPFRRHTRTRWVAEMTAVLREADTDQALNVVTWLERSADAPGASTHIDGLPFSFRTHPEDLGTKETVGGFSAGCGRKARKSSSCNP